MEKEIQILQDLFIPVLQKDERFDASKCDNTFWEKILQEFIVYQQDSKPFYATIYSLELAEPMKVIHKLENLQHSFLDQLAEESLFNQVFLKDAILLAFNLIARRESVQRYNKKAT